jgi:hypothetical protein
MTLPILTKHAKQRIRERFAVKEGGEQAFVDKHFPKAEYIYEEEGYSIYMSGKIKFVIGDGLLVTIVDTNEFQKGTAKMFKSRIQAFIKSEIDRIKATGDSAEQFAHLLKTDVIAELAERYDELKRTRSIPKKLALKGRIVALEERLGEIPTDIRDARREVRKQINGALAHY